jgi:hypothetical protein
MPQRILHGSGTIQHEVVADVPANKARAIDAADRVKPKARNLLTMEEAMPDEWQSVRSGRRVQIELGIAILTFFLAAPVAAQHQHGHAPYAGMQHRAVKALSEQQIEDLRAGRGMGLAMAAELNGYPGPIHALELADGLQLTGDQKLRLQQLFEDMKAEAIAAGERLITREQALDQEFSGRTMTPERLVSLTASIGETQGELRAVHLKYHLTTAELLTADQRRRYAELRGYR